MALSVFDIPEEHFLENAAKYKRELIAHTKFGAGAGFQGQYKADHAVLDSGRFNMTPMVRQLWDRAASQLGSSGGGKRGSASSTPSAWWAWAGAGLAW